MKLAYTPIHQKNYIFISILLLSVSVYLSQITESYNTLFYVFIAFFNTLFFYKVNFYDFISIKDHFLMVPTLTYKEKIDLHQFQSYEPICNNTLILRNEDKLKMITFNGINQHFTLELETILEAHGLKQIDL